MNDKIHLLEMIAGTNRGLLAGEKDRVKILTAVEHLEDHNPYPHPLETGFLLDGVWRLLYTTSRNVLGLGRFPLVQLGEVYQCIQTTEAKLYNLAEFRGLPWLESLVAVAASYQRVSERRIEVHFERSLLGFQRLMGYESPTQLIQALELEQKFWAIDVTLPRRESLGWLETTYVDNDLRIGRGNEGSVFILARSSPLIA